MGTDDLRAAADDDVLQRGVRSDDRTGGDRGGAAQLRVRLDGRVRFDADGHVDPGRGRIEHADAGAHQIGVDPVAQPGGERRELGPVVRAEALLGIAHRVGGDRSAGGHQQVHDVGEILLALVVRGHQLPERVAQRRGVERVYAGVHLIDRKLLGCRVPMLDDAGDPAPVVPHDAPEPGRVVDLRGEHGGDHSQPLVGVEHRGQGPGAQHGCVAVDHDDGAGHVRSGVQRRADGMTGPALFGLQHRFGSRGDLGQVCRDLLGTVTDDDDLPLRAERLGGV
jgi:hypothetical protein